MAPFWRWLENVSATECFAMFLDRINMSADLDKGSRLVASVLFSIRCEWNGAALTCGIVWVFADTSCQIRFCSLMRMFVLKISKASLSGVSGVCKSVSGWEMGRAGINTFFYSKWSIMNLIVMWLQINSKKELDIWNNVPW